ncbi:hypothetical protein PENANT_c023G06811 [Penicillium antarcticum]|uniref:Synaptobrevin n=1 Tax=Penicillium antarcticum TaxID=416450 RepID=A0A1V6Q091_9EURO|nr:hypothetical protein PENANT_c023G06811 [Penicillium antarcticum]
MTVTAFPTEGSPDLALLNVARLFTRLEHNLLSPGTDRRSLQQSEYQRMRINKNVEYARTLLTQLERTIPSLKPLDRKHEAQAEIARDRQLLKRIQSILDEEDAKAQLKLEQEEDDDDDEGQDGNDEWNELFSKPISQEKVNTSTPPQKMPPAPIHTTEPQWDEMDEGHSTSAPSLDTSGPSITLTEPTPTSATASSGLPTLRNRHTSSTSTSTFTAAAERPTATTTSSSTNTNSQSNSTTERDLSTHRLEQEDLTSSLLTLASQLKSSSKTFQSTLEGEKSALDRAVSGIDRTKP